MVTYVTTDSTLTGVGKYAQDLYLLLAPESKIYQFLFNRKFLDSFYKQPYTGFKSPLLNYTISGLAFKSGINTINHSNDIIHITSQTIKPIFKNKNIAITIHDVIPFHRNTQNDDIMEKIKQHFIRRYIKEYLKYNNIVTLTSYIKSQLISEFNVREENIIIIPPYIPDSFFPLSGKEQLRKELGLPLDKKLILSISSDQPRKNIPMVKSVMDNLDGSFKLVRVGIPVGDSITFNDVDTVKLNKIYNASDMLFLPTLEEGFGYPVVEAFKTGLPVLTSNIDVIKEVSDGAALLVNPEELKENVEGVYRVIDNHEYYVKKGYERSKYYVSSTVKEKLISYYKGIS
ncbi:glycosyltransferase [Ferroplasma sp.]|uniref:glycosyltransferase n=1 Tax=Ferroplasma sp. TaxID=2591003 RepID=UPI002616E067|nr:glycosyltransferase [Ferroplasma sp.]